VTQKKRTARSLAVEIACTLSDNELDEAETIAYLECMIHDAAVDGDLDQMKDPIARAAAHARYQALLDKSLAKRGS
jgi:hypothetical protein